MFTKKSPSILSVKCKNAYKDTLSNEIKSKIAILVPVSSYIERSCEESLKVLEQDGIKVYRKWGFSAIDQGRCVLAQMAINDGYEHLVWIDSDISFYPWDVYKLISHELKFVTGAYTVKGWPRLTTKFHPDFKIIEFGKNGGLYEVTWAATGFMYAHVDVYKDIVKKYKMKPVKIWGGEYLVHPWFFPMIVNDQYIGEDFSFCERAIKSGHKIYCDTTIRLSHIGKYEYSYDFMKRNIKSEPEEFIYYNN